MAIDPDQADWALGQLAPGGSLQAIRGLRQGGAPWLISAVSADGAEVQAVLRVGPLDGPDDILREAAALDFVHGAGLPVPTVMGMRYDFDPALLLIGVVPGSSLVPQVPDESRFRALGAFAASLNARTPPPGFDRRDRSVIGVDFAALRRQAAPQPLLLQAEAVVASYTPRDGGGMVHGDLWQGNTLWRGDELTGVIDWDCAGFGPGGVDLGSLRVDVATSHGVAWADSVLHGWQQVGGVAPDLAYWDVVAALCTPPEIDWFGDTIRDQGRPDLTQQVLRQRRDEFLADALRRVEAGR